MRPQSSRASPAGARGRAPRGPFAGRTSRRTRLRRDPRRAGPSASSTSGRSASPRATSSARLAGCRGRGSLHPVPGRSRRRQRNDGIAAARSAQLVPHVVPPCTNSTGGPAPISWTLTSIPSEGRRTRCWAGRTPREPQRASSAARRPQRSVIVAAPTRGASGGAIRSRGTMSRTVPDRCTSVTRCANKSWSQGGRSCRSG